jgi:hypothetical protein
VAGEADEANLAFLLGPQRLGQGAALDDPFRVIVVVRVSQITGRSASLGDRDFRSPGQSTI